MAGKHPPKAYKNPEFLTAPEARTIRILCEYEEPWARFRRLGVRDTIVFFGSARILPPEVAQARLDALRGRGENISTPGRKLVADIAQAELLLHHARYYAAARELARRLTLWSQQQSSEFEKRFVICSGGGPGIMEAANRGAMDAGGPTVGLNISLPFEQEPNAYLPPELSFEFHYFFMRKYWFVYMGKALVVFPGGFGTFDEMMEVLTLIQTDKLRKKMPVLLFGEEYWREVINFDALVKWGMIAARDLELLHMTDSVDDAYDYITGRLTRLYLRRRREGTHD